MSGLASISGRAGEPPTAVGAPVVDQHGAALLAMAVLASLLERTRTGLGQKVEVSMLRAALDLQQEVITYYLNGGAMRKSPTSLASMIHPGPYGIYETKDGYLALSMSQLPVLQEAMQLPGLAPLANEPYNHPAREQIARILEPVIRTRTTAEWVEYLVPRGVWAAPVLDYDGTFGDPAVREAGVVEEVDHPAAGRIRLLRSPLAFSSGQAASRRHAPMPGEHREEILKEVGYTEAEVHRLQEQGVV
jgi:crotonobetainyl-CoA:carnitine CoA-transferase CaiB-like acyl-CoA transferase